MIGRAAYRHPPFLGELHDVLYPKKERDNFQSLLNRYTVYMERELNRGTRLHDMTRHLLGLFRGLPGSRHYRRYLSDHARRGGADIDTFHRACAEIELKAA